MMLEEFRNFISENELDRTSYHHFKPVIDKFIEQQNKEARTNSYASLIGLSVYWGLFNGLSLITGGPLMDYNTLKNINEITSYCVERYLIHKQHDSERLDIEVPETDRLEVDFYKDTDLLGEVINSDELIAPNGTLVINLYDDDKSLEKRLKKELKWVPKGLNVNIIRLEDMTWDGVEELVIDYEKGLDLYSEVFDKEPVLARGGELIVNHQGLDKYTRKQLKKLSDYFKITEVK